MDLNTISNLPTGTPGAAPGNTGNALVSSDFQTFLRMLTAQIQNQDPLNPVDSSDYAVQLATFSSVEQQVQTNQLLETMVARLSGSSMSDLARWIGLEAQFGQSTDFTGAPIDLALLQDARADQAVLVVHDAAGDEVQRIPVALGEANLEWAGTADDGTPFAHGTYSFSLENFAAGTLISTTPAQRYGTVVEARIDGGATLLVLEDGSLIRPEHVTAVRDAG